MTNEPPAETANACALTGHRELEENFDSADFKKAIRRLIEQKGVTVFYCGMALGFDMRACAYLLRLKGKFPQVKVVACIPCPQQSDTFPPQAKREYDRLVAHCDEKVVIAEHYSPGCMLARNRYMVDRAAYLIAYLRKETGGTAYTVRYAEKKGVEITYL